MKYINTSLANGSISKSVRIAVASFATFLLGIAGFSLLANAATPVNIAVNSAGRAYTSSSGVVFSADTGFINGYTDTTTAPVTNTKDSTLYQSNRYGNFSYQFAVPNGDYNITLQFAETYWTAAGNRVFNVNINGTAVLSDFDIFSVAGGLNIAIDKSFPVTVTGGQVTIQFISVTDNALISALQIVPVPVPSPSSSPTPSETQPTVAVDCAGLQFFSSTGAVYSADTGFTGGYTDTITAAVANTKDSTLYQSNRYGNFSYSFNVPNGNYNVVLKFAETYWAAAGDRVFNATINGASVLSSFDIFKEAGGRNIAIDKIFPVIVTRRPEIF